MLEPIVGIYWPAKKTDEMSRSIIQIAKAVPCNDKFIAQLTNRK